MKFSLRHQSTGNLYPFIVQLGDLMVRGFFRKIFVANRKIVPTDKPVLLAANHPTAFVDPCLLGVFIDAPLYNMTRGDVFKKPLFRKLMESINMFPVFRVRDGYTGRDRNQQVFAFCEGKLVQNRVVTIYVEGEHRLVKQVRPIQKGILRIAFGTYEKHQLTDLQIIPAGCSYVYGDRPRDEAMVQIGSPIYVRDYWQEYQEHDKRAMARLSADIEAGLKAVCLHIDDLNDADLLEDLLRLYRSAHSESLIPIVVYNENRFQAEKAICNQVNALAADTKKNLFEQSKQYFTRLNAAGLNDDALLNPQWANWSRLFLFALGLIPFLIGYLTSYPVIFVSKYVAEEKVKKLEFYTSVRMGLGLLWGVVYYFLWFLACLIIWNPWYIAFSLTLPILGWFSMFYRENWVRWKTARQAMRHPSRQALLDLRQAIKH